MSTRQDAWTKDEDLLLAETVLRYIREGKTQMKAFEEVGNRLSRTPQACGFRWNANLRKQYRQAIGLAKQSRKKISEQTISAPPAGSKRLTVFDEVITQLEQLKGDYYKGGHRVNQDEPDEYAHLRQQLDQYEQLIDEIYEKISEVKKREQVK
ncbi:RsfA family transcriptional regulator [Aquisalibacillus elongatus]|uniref:RsfA family transcription factor n=1 Tax=Aquisalibacillus elongatus TaxID=485577 RepID=A0A3N5BF24_9BACI|nr:RsfA family transcriptional regulator [Aquisalibacillus elongatus]RPF56093.1 RsfA family transcription factor [Aquisalibacillus elongatus]